MKRIATIVCMLLGLVLVGTTGLRAQSSQALSLNYPDFSNVSFISMNGTTQQENGALRLTTALPQSAGSAFYSDRQADLTQPIHTAFSFYLHDSTTPVPADGITFTIQGQGLGALGATGSGLGYSGISPSVAVGFNTFVTGANPGGNAVGMYKSGSAFPVVTAYPAFSLYGQIVHAWVDYDPGIKTLQVFVSRTSIKPATPLLSEIIDLSSLIGPAGWVGFTGSTGTDTQVNDITSWTLTATAVPLALSTAQLTPAVVNIGGVCYVVPTYAYSPTCSITPIPPASAGRPLLAPNKTLDVSGPIPLGGGAFDNRTVTVTSSVACFSLDEPIDLYTMGNPNASALRPLSPASIPLQTKNHYRFSVDPGSHIATFSLETVPSAIDATGLGVKAVWPQEGIERVRTLVQAATATATATEVPGGPTDTPSPTATPSATQTPATTGTPAPTATSTQTPIPAGPFVLRTCIDQNPVPTAGSATIFGQTTPGAVCTASIRFNNGTSPDGFDGTAQTALSDGFVLFPFTASSTASSGVARVTCTLNGQVQVSTLSFLIAQSPQAGNPELFPLPVIVSVSPSNVRSGQQLIVSAEAPRGARCVAAVNLSGAFNIPFNGYAQKVPADGLIGWTFTVQTQGTGTATATVTCALNGQTGQGSATFTVSG